MIYKPLPTPEELHKRFFIKNGKLYRRIKANKMKPGSLAGTTVSQSGYMQVRINNSRFQVHRVIWVMHYGPIPDGMQVDHKDHNPKNNAITNLRLVTHAENMKNHPLRKTSKTGVTGVWWHPSVKLWCASIKHEGKTHYLGFFPTIPQAAAVRQAAEKRFGFYRNHGKRV